MHVQCLASETRAIVGKRFKDISADRRSLCSRWSLRSRVRWQLPLDFYSLITVVARSRRIFAIIIIRRLYGNCVGTYLCASVNRRQIFEYKDRRGGRKFEVDRAYNAAIFN